MRLTPRFLGVARNDEVKNVIQSGVGVSPPLRLEILKKKYACSYILLEISCNAPKVAYTSLIARCAFSWEIP